ncbi:uncharacterized protein LOC143586125 [Bidens hawaiensis]|uniref:uncharacterized protein LOC143586125 n=1 Tax=Bidens hawaiensis TaxID=980011 RepID=UPI004049340F
MKAYRAKNLAKEQINGNFISQYGLLRDYIEELKNANLGTTVHLEVENCTDPTSETRTFKRIYVCLEPLKQGFKAIGRDLLGLDGAFLKSVWPGQLLTAVGLDPNNGYYPLAYAVVEAEQCSLGNGFCNALGLIQAVERVFPTAEHRFCVRHITENIKHIFKGKIYTDAIWKLAACTTNAHYEREMDNLKRLNKKAHLWVSKIPPEYWSRSHFIGRAPSDVFTNNMCEVFNSKLVDGRDKPIITLLEYIREYLMRKIVNVLKVIDKSLGLLTPYATKVMDLVIKEANRYNVQWNGEEHYQVTGPNGDQCVVNLRTNTCACRRWEVTGIPCRHVVASVWVKAAHDPNVGRPETYVNLVYTMERWRAVYNYKVYPINDMTMWPKSKVQHKSQHLRIISLLEGQRNPGKSQLWKLKKGKKGKKENGKTLEVEEQGPSKKAKTGYDGADEARMLQRHFNGTSVKIGVGANRAATAASIFHRHGFIKPLDIACLEKLVAKTRVVSDKIGVAILDDGMQVK